MALPHPLTSFFHVFFKPLRSEPVERENPELKEDSGTCVVGGREATFVVEQFATNSSIEDRFHAPVAALLVYLCCTLFVSAFVFNFISVVMLLAIDFWTVKNVSGRLLVGLRWWNEVTEEGESLWKFESLDVEGMKNVNAEESRIFWMALYINPFGWCLFGIVALVKLELDYLMVVAVALVLSVSNIIGYTKCRKDAKNRISEVATSFMSSGVSSMLGASGF